MSARRRLLVALAVLTPFVLLVLAVGGFLFLRQGGFAPYRVPVGSAATVAPTPAALARGEYVARIGNCSGCHTARGGTPFAGGRAFATPWGTIHSSNLTPDPRAGLGAWSLEEFRHAMRHGVSRNGVLYPAFPYAHFALLDDADLDALYAWLRTLPPSAQAPPPNRLGFPADWRPAQVLWRMLHYRPQDRDFGAAMSPEWRRGRYLVDGLGHCAMCHGRRGAMGSLPLHGYLGGGRIPGSGWYAPPLDARQLQRYSEAELADYLRSGTSAHGAAYGPMAEVVYQSLRYLMPADAHAMAVFLKSVPPRPPLQRPLGEGVRGVIDDGAALYKQHCADCHGADGRGKASKYPPLVGTVAVTAPDPINAVRLILYGAMPPTTAQNPRPYSMPPFVQRLDASEVAAIANYIRATFGEQPPVLSAAEVQALHGLGID